MVLVSNVVANEICRDKTRAYELKLNRPLIANNSPSVFRTENIHFIIKHYNKGDFFSFTFNSLQVCNRDKRVHRHPEIYLI